MKFRFSIKQVMVLMALCGAAAGAFVLIQRFWPENNLYLSAVLLCLVFYLFMFAFPLLWYLFSGRSKKLTPKIREYSDDELLN